MSEKYSMNELLAWIEKQCSLVDGEWGCASSCEDECKGPKDAIIAQLRAADNLKNKSLMKLAADLGVSFSAAKIISDHAREEYDAKITKADKLCEVANIIIKEIAFYDDDDSDEYIICQFKDLIQLRKAIAEYREGK
jgi:hypothetical protein